MNKEIKYSLGLTALLSAYFLIMRFFGQSETLILRLFNVFIIFGVTFYYLNQLRQKDELDYLKGLGAGIKISSLGVLGFAIFMGFYTTFDVAFLTYIQTSEGLGRFINPFTIMVSIMMEGIGMGLLSTYISLQFLKTANLKNMEENYS